MSKRGKVTELYPGLRDATLAQTERRRRRGTGLITWRCDGCGRVDTWSPSWSWWGSLLGLDDCGTEDIRVACQDKCRRKAMARR